jgi:hypothetical protein
VFVSPGTLSSVVTAVGQYNGTQTTFLERNKAVPSAIDGERADIADHLEGGYSSNIVSFKYGPAKRHFDQLGLCGKLGGFYSATDSGHKARHKLKNTTNES